MEESNPETEVPSPETDVPGPETEVAGTSDEFEQAQPAASAIKAKPQQPSSLPKTLFHPATRQGLVEFRTQVPSWVTSLILHGAVLLLLGFLTLPLTAPPELSLEAARVVQQTLEIEEVLLEIEFDLELQTLEASVDEAFESDPQVEISAEAFGSDNLTPLETITEVVDFGASLSDVGTTVQVQGMSSSGLDGRGAASKADLLRQGGGTRSSEQAVLDALEWLARHQYPDGSWNFNHTQSECDGRCGQPGSASQARAAATGLALMTYLGAGQTQVEGRYQQTVLRGIYALGTMIKANQNGGSFHEPQGNMYSHGIATIALCEAYAMTGEPALLAPAQAAIDFICYAQDPHGGGWRYSPRQPGDTSVMGWQIAALKSGYLSALHVPPIVINRAAGFLDSVMTANGSRYHYNDDQAKGHHACTAIGALCRMYMGGIKNDVGVQAAIESLSQRGPSASDAYYNYYAAQALFHYTGGTGPRWKLWNDKMRDMLVGTQAKTGHETGSWAPSKDHTAEKGGRLFTTAMSTMTLEVYYRMLPIYREDAVAGDFEK